MAWISSMAELADVLGIANLILNGRQTRQLKMLKHIMANQKRMMSQLEESKKGETAEDEEH